MEPCNCCGYDITINTKQTHSLPKKKEKIFWQRSSSRVVMGRRKISTAACTFHTFHRPSTRPSERGWPYTEAKSQEEGLVERLTSRRARLANESKTWWPAGWAEVNSRCRRSNEPTTWRERRRRRNKKKSWDVDCCAPLVFRRRVCFFFFGLHETCVKSLMCIDY